MKAFIWSMIALLCLCGIVIWNANFVSRSANEMTKYASDIHNLSDKDELLALERVWLKDRLLISISVPHKESDEFEKNLILLKSKFENGIEVEIAETVALILRSIEEIKIHGTATVDNIF